MCGEKSGHVYTLRRFARITPACAGKSLTIPKLTTRSWDHPRVCGEKCNFCTLQKLPLGSPPRVRGKVQLQPGQPAALGITPACAGKSTPSMMVCSRFWDHPRVCGEKFRPFAARFESMGSPPRVRGKGSFLSSSCTCDGITPACAGKRTSLFAGVWVNPGSPPRVRGKVTSGNTNLACMGITPACAGKSCAYGSGIPDDKDHPRVCGEKGVVVTVGFLVQGSPPRVRGKVPNVPMAPVTEGITPACAGKRPVASAPGTGQRDHPRVCGEKCCSSIFRRNA